MNQMNELNQAFEDYLFGNFTGIAKVFKVGILSFICFVKINCVLLYLSNKRRAKIVIYDRSD